MHKLHSSITLLGTGQVWKSPGNISALKATKKPFFILTACKIIGLTQEARKVECFTAHETVGLRQKF